MAVMRKEGLGVVWGRGMKGKIDENGIKERGKEVWM